MDAASINNFHFPAKGRLTNNTIRQNRKTKFVVILCKLDNCESKSFVGAPPVSK